MGVEWCGVGVVRGAGAAGWGIVSVRRPAEGGVRGAGRRTGGGTAS